MPVTFTATQWVELVAVVTMPLTVVVYVVQRTITGGALIKGSIQLVGVLMLLPLILVLGLEKVIPEPALGTLLGAVAGYLLSNLGGDGDYAAPAPKTNAAPPPSASAPSSTSASS